MLKVPLTLLACFSVGHAFFSSYNKKNADMRSGVGNAPPPNGGPQQQQWYRDVYPPWQPFSFDAPGPVAVAVPVAVPIQAQLAGGGHTSATLKGTLHNVQLVPCLCPINRDMDPMTPSQSQMQANHQMQPQGAPAAYIVQPAPVQQQNPDM